MPTTNPVPSTDPTDLLFNAGKLDEVVSGSSSTYTDRLGISRRTMAGIDAAADLVLSGLGYAPPAAYAAGISLTLTTQTVEYAGEVYAPKVANLPFTTSGTFETAKFRLIQGVASADLASGGGAAMVGYTPAGTGAVATTVQTQFRKTIRLSNYVKDGVNPEAVDFGPYLQDAVNDAAAFTPKKKLLIDIAFMLRSAVNVPCIIENDGGKIRAYPGASLLFNTPYVYSESLDIEVIETDTNRIIEITSAHVDVRNPKIIYTVNDTPAHIGINVRPPNTSGVWDVKIDKPYIRGVFTGIRVETTPGGVEGWVTDIKITNSTIIAFRLHGIFFDDVAAKGINYCSVDNLTLENIGVNSMLKYGIACNGTLFGNSFTNIKDFNDDPLLGTYYTISCADPALNALAAAGGSPTLANHAMQFTRNVFSNIRAEGLIDLGLLRNLYTLRDVHVYNKVGILPLMGYDYYHDYGSNMLKSEVNLASATLTAVVPANFTLIAGENRLKVFVSGSPTGSLIGQVNLPIPLGVAAMANQTKYLTVAMSSDFFTKIPVGANFSIRRKATNLPLDGTLPSVNMRADKRLAVLTYNLNSVVLELDDYICITFEGVAGDIYSIGAVFAYSSLANPILDLAPFIETAY